VNGAENCLTNYLRLSQKKLIRIIGDVIMNRESDKISSPVFYFIYGGGTLPLLGDKGYQNLINFIREVTVQNKHPLCQI
jgi:hypothetical protein